MDSRGREERRFAEYSTTFVYVIKQGVCWHSDEMGIFNVNQGGTADFTSVLGVQG